MTHVDSCTINICSRRSSNTTTHTPKLIVWNSLVKFLWMKFHARVRPREKVAFIRLKAVSYDKLARWRKRRRRKEARFGIINTKMFLREALCVLARLFFSERPVQVSCSAKYYWLFSSSHRHKPFLHLTDLMHRSLSCCWSLLLIFKIDVPYMAAIQACGKTSP